MIIKGILKRYKTFNKNNDYFNFINKHKEEIKIISLKIKDRHIYLTYIK